MGLDLFSGAGGLSLGLESTGFITTGWAVEFDVSAARTFGSVLALFCSVETDYFENRDSHPHAIIYNACLNKLLHHAVDLQQGIKHTPVKSLDDEDLPPFPVEGSVDIIFGGPPW
jgi:DNA (cytosine-5)-methyltransferase 1